VRLVIEKDLGDPSVSFAVYRAPVSGNWATGSLTAHKPATASNVHSGGTEFGPDKAVDDDRNTRWATSDETRECWLEVDLLEEESIGRLSIRELQPRITKFRIEFRNTPAGDWRTAFEGGKAGTDFATDFPPVKARHVRLHILDATFAPTIWEFGLLPPARK
jgi:alpha-L-fucosidase